MNTRGGQHQDRQGHVLQCWMRAGAHTRNYGKDFNAAPLLRCVVASCQLKDDLSSAKQSDKLHAIQFATPLDEIRFGQYLFTIPANRLMPRRCTRLYAVLSFIDSAFICFS